ncbi:hypothetical protein KKA47_01590 [bacterium]|nr:hypothetical protein [bacterium]
MKILKIILILFVVASVGYLIAKEFAGNKKIQAGTTLNAQSAKHSDGIIVYYFHGNRRCRTCKAIEEYMREAVMPYISNKQAIWETVNIDDSNNKHFILDFNLASSGPAIVEYGNNKVKHWKTLDKVWQLVRNKEAFNEYVDGELASFIKRKLHD